MWRLHFELAFSRHYYHNRLISATWNELHHIRGVAQILPILRQEDAKSENWISELQTLRTRSKNSLD
jgi:hypothetical protein